MMSISQTMGYCPTGKTNARIAYCQQCGLRLAAHSGQQWEYFGIAFTTTRPAYLCRACHQYRADLVEAETQLRQSMAVIRAFCDSQLGDMSGICFAHVETIIRACGLRAEDVADRMNGILFSLGHVEYHDVIEAARYARRLVFPPRNDDECTCDPTGERPACHVCKQPKELPY